MSPASPETVVQIVWSGCASPDVAGLSIVTGPHRLPGGTQRAALEEVEQPTPALLVNAEGSTLLAALRMPGQRQLSFDPRSTIVVTAMMHPLIFGLSAAQRVQVAKELPALPPIARLSAQLAVGLCENPGLALAALTTEQEFSDGLEEAILAVAPAMPVGVGVEALSSPCYDPQGSLSIGSYCTSGMGSATLLSISNKKAISFGVRYRRGGVDVFDIVDAKQGLVEFDGGRIFDFELPFKFKEETTFALPDRNTQVEIAAGFPGPRCPFFPVKDLVDGCLLGLDTDPRSHATWGNIVNFLSIAMDLAGGLPAKQRKVLSRLVINTAAKLRVRTFLEYVPNDPCLMLAFEPAMQAIATFLDGAAASELDPSRRKLYTWGAQLARVIKESATAIAPLLTGKTSLQIRTQCGNLIDKYYTRFTGNKNLVNARLHKAVYSGQSKQILDAIVKETLRDLNLNVPTSVMDSAISAISFHRLGEDVAARRYGQALGDVAVLFIDNQEILFELLKTIGATVTDRTVDDLLRFALGAWLNLAVTGVNRAVPFVYDMATARGDSFCYAGTCAVPPPRPELPDLSIVDVRGPSVAVRGGEITVPVRLNRQRGQLTNGFYTLVRVYLSKDTTITDADTLCSADDDVTSHFLNDPLNRFGSLEQGVRCVIPVGLAPGSFFIGALVDPLSFHPESDEANNSRSGNQLVVSAPPMQPDLSVLDVSGPATAVQGGVARVTVRVQRTGGSLGAQQVQVRVYLSTDSTIGELDTLCSVDAASQFASTDLNLSGSRSQEVECKIPAGYTPGEVYFGAIVDPASLNKHLESNEANNGAVGNKVVVQATGGGCPLDAQSLLSNGAFNLGMTCWEAEEHGTGTSTFTPDTGTFQSAPQSLRISNDRVRPNEYELQLTRRPLPITAGHRYRIRFAAKAQAARPLRLSMTEDLTYADLGLWEEQTLTTSWGPYEATFVAKFSTARGKLGVMLGQSDKTVWIDDLSLEDLGRPSCNGSGAELLGDGSFNLGMTCWEAEEHGTGTSTFTPDAGTFQSAPQSLRISNDRARPNEYELQLTRRSLPIIAGHRYRVSLAAKAQTTRPLRLSMSEDLTYADLGLWEERTLTTSWAPYEATFVAKFTTARGKFGVMLGQSDKTVWLDDLSIEDLGP